MVGLDVIVGHSPSVAGLGSTPKRSIVVVVVVRSVSGVTGARANRQEFDSKASGFVQGSGYKDGVPRLIKEYTLN